PDRNHADAAIEAHQRSLSAGRERKQQGGRKQTSRECLFHNVLPYKLKSKTAQGTTPPAEPLFRYRVQILAHSCPGCVRQHVRSWRKPTPHCGRIRWSTD